jgi:hypothetical protein
MIKKSNRPQATRIPLAQSFTAGVAFLFLIVCDDASAYERYKSSSGTGNCSTCHGDFTDGTSPQGTVFPSNNKHTMHRGSTSMATACNLCHTSGDGGNPYLGSSSGTTINPGLGCTGCHSGPGLRQHHEANGISSCMNCHDPATIEPEGTKPPYYGTSETKANNPCNLVKAANTNENWSVGDFLGLDNDGNNLYDELDLGCAPPPPYQMVSAKQEGDNLRITWQTAGGRTDILQAAGSVLGLYTNVSPALPIPGSGTVTTNYVDVGAATNRTRFYRVTAQP